MKLLSIVLIFLPSTFVFSQTKLKNNLKNEVTFLASDALEGRSTGKRGELLAAGYIMGKFYKSEVVCCFFD